MRVDLKRKKITLKFLKNTQRGFLIELLFRFHQVKIQLKNSHFPKALIRIKCANLKLFYDYFILFFFFLYFISKNFNINFQKKEKNNFVIKILKKKKISQI